MHDGVKMVRDAIARRVCDFNFLPSLPFHSFALVKRMQVRRKLKEKLLCDLCDSSEAPRGGMQARAVNQSLNNNELFSNAELANQRFSFSMNLEPLNSEPVNGYF
jgi:hypothetical protein